MLMKVTNSLHTKNHIKLILGSFSEVATKGTQEVLHPAV